MIIDKNLQLSDAQAVTASAASTNVIDLGAAYQEVAQGGMLHLVVSVPTTVTAAGAATVTVALQQSADNSTYTDVVVSPAIGKASLAAGAQVVLPVPPGLASRYLRAYYTVATGPLTAGTFSANIVSGIQQSRAYPDAL